MGVREVYALISLNMLGKANAAVLDCSRSMISACCLTTRTPVDNSDEFEVPAMIMDDDENKGEFSFSVY